MGKNRFKNRVHNERTRFYWYGEIYSFFEIIKSASLKEKSSLSWRKRMLTFAFNSLSSKSFRECLDFLEGIATVDIIVKQVRLWFL